MTEEKRTFRARLTFDEWFRTADRICALRYGVGLQDLPDCDFWGWWDSEVSPAEAAERAVREFGFFDL